MTKELTNDRGSLVEDWSIESDPDGGSERLADRLKRGKRVIDQVQEASSASFRILVV